MSRLQLLIILILIIFHVNKAQENPNSDPQTLHPFHPSLPVIIGILSIMLLVVFLLLAYAKFCHTTPFDFLNSNPHHHNFHGLIRSRSRFSGIDKAVIEALPFFRFSSLRGSKEGLECAVCLSKFEDTEILRLLPKCSHAFHANCIDQWLERHSSCPLCRYKFDVKDLKNVTYSNSFRYLENPSNLTDDPNLEIFVQREQDQQGSTRFNIGNSFRIMGRGRKEDLLIQDDSFNSRNLLDKFKHKIIISDVVIKNRWSDVNSSDLLSLNSEMLSVMSSNRFSPSNSSVIGISDNEQIGKIKDDIERKRMYECRFNQMESNYSIPSSSFQSMKLNPDERRSMSEITMVSRYPNFHVKNKSKESSSGGNHNTKEERMRRIWLPIARKTVQWFANRESGSRESAYKRHPSNV